MNTLDLDEAAEYLKISSDTMRDLADSGEIPGAKVGKQWVFSEDDLAAYLRVVIKNQTAARRNAAESGKRQYVKTQATRVRENARRLPPELPELPGEV